MDDLQRFNETIDALEKGEIRVAYKTDGEWKVNSWVKDVILSGFRLGKLTEFNCGPFSYLDKDTFPPRRFSLEDCVRIVPGGSAVRRGAYLSPSVVMMPPSYVNVGAWIGEGSMVDSNVIVGSCAQIGAHVHLAANSQVGGVLEPAGALPVIIEDDAFIGGGSGIYEGTIIGKGAVIAAGVSITRSTPVYDSVNDIFITPDNGKALMIPENAVVVSGSRPLKGDNANRYGIHVYMPVIIKYRDNKTSVAIALEEALR